MHCLADRSTSRGKRNLLVRGGVDRVARSEFRSEAAPRLRVERRKWILSGGSSTTLSRNRSRSPSHLVENNHAQKIPDSLRIGTWRCGKDLSQGKAKRARSRLVRGGVGRKVPREIHSFWFLLHVGHYPSTVESFPQRHARARCLWIRARGRLDSVSAFGRDPSDRVTSRDTFQSKGSRSETRSAEERRRTRFHAGISNGHGPLATRSKRDHKNTNRPGEMSGLCSKTGDPAHAATVTKRASKRSTARCCATVARTFSPSLGELRNGTPSPICEVEA